MRSSLVTWGRSPKWGPMVPWAETSGCLTVHGRRVVMIRHLAVDSWKVALPFRPSSLPYLHPLTHPIPYPHTECQILTPARPVPTVAPWLRGSDIQFLSHLGKAQQEHWEESPATPVEAATFHRQGQRPPPGPPSPWYGQCDRTP